MRLTLKLNPVDFQDIIFQLNTTLCNVQQRWEIRSWGLLSQSTRVTLQRKEENKSKNKEYSWTDINCFGCFSFLCLIWTKNRYTPALKSPDIPDSMLISGRDTEVHWGGREEKSPKPKVLLCLSACGAWRQSSVWLKILNFEAKILILNPMYATH